MSEAVLDEVRQIKQCHEKELVELRQQFQLLQQSLSRTEEHLAKAAVAPAPVTVVEPVEEKATDKLADLISRENDQLKNEIQALRQQLSTALIQSSSSVSPTPSSSSPRSASASKSKQEHSKEIKGVRKPQSSIALSTNSARHQPVSLKHKTGKAKSKSGDHARAADKVSSTSPPPTATTEAPPTMPATTSSFCQIDLGSLTAHLTCVLCQHLLLDAVVLRCSHGFCRLCIEKHARRKESTCPICKDPPLESRAESKANMPSSSASAAKRSRNVFADFIAKREEVEQGGTTGSDGDGGGKKASATGHNGAREVERWYHRSDHLDSLVWMVLSAASEEARQQFRQREEAAVQELKELGIDASAGYHYAEGALQELFPRNRHDQQRNGKSESEKSRRSEDDTDEDERLCEYCGGRAHGEGVRCPHKADSSEEDDRNDEEQEEEDDEDEEDF